MLHFVDDLVAMLVDFSRRVYGNVTYESVSEKRTTKLPRGRALVGCFDEDVILTQVACQLRPVACITGFRTTMIQLVLSALSWSHCVIAFSIPEINIW